MEHLLPGPVWLGPQQRVVLLSEMVNEAAAHSQPALTPSELIDGLKKTVTGQ
ncbi:MAG: hypothetical protein SGPRY_007436, partial [Prymnesium sp.]